MNKMKIGILEKLRSYLFLKILVVFAFALLAIFVLILTTNRLFFQQKAFSTIQRNAVNHVQHIINELGIPPDIKKAQRLAEGEKIQIRFQGSTLKWSSHEDMIDFPGLQLPDYNVSEGISAGFSEAGLTVDIRKDNGRYLIILHRRGEGFRDAAKLFVINVLIFTTLSIIGIYLIMNWQLKPIKVLREGVKQLSEGNIDYQMSTNRIDELGKLVDSFNIMTQKIREMLHTRDRLLQDVSHELRSPLTRVKVALEFLKDNTIKKAINDDISEMETMIRELLETERLESQHGGLELGKTNIMKLLREIYTEFQNQKPGIKLVSFPDDFYLNVDQKRIKILFRNILDNALRYSHPLGYPVEVSLREKADEIIIAVQDFGSGIPEQELPYIFEPFYRVDKSRSKKTGGYGLGMSLSKRIMETHGGTIEITSKLNVGTIVFLKFPHGLKD
jgi:signal transduction histidine kinase